MIGQYFNLIMLILIVASVLITLVDKFCFAPQRRAKVLAENPQAAKDKKTFKRLCKPPALADYARDLWPIFVIVFLVRAFLFSPFVIPSGSELPTLKLHDFILVNHYAYGLRNPLTHQLWVPISKPKRGDIIVFPFPVDPNVDLIKTVIGLPGDKVSYINKQLYINGKKLPMTFVQNTKEPLDSTMPNVPVKEYIQQIGNSKHHVYITSNPPLVNFKNLVVPKGEYFVMGDDRDFSEDSRYWGFVPFNTVIGKASMIWFSINTKTWHIRWGRIGKRLP